MKIGEVEKITGIQASTIRYWEERGCIKTDRSDNSYRSYGMDDVEKLLQIKRLREIGIAISDIKLWVDGLVKLNKLIEAHAKQLDIGEEKSKYIRELCLRIMSETSSNESSSGTLFCESETEVCEPLALGIDIGSTTVSAQVVSLTDGRAVHTFCLDHNALLTVGVADDAFAYDADILCGMAVGLAESVCDTYRTVVSIGVAGQMHGIVCLNDACDILSPFYTWQNQFGQRMLDGATICERIRQICGKTAPTGYGLVTRFALKRLGLLPHGTTRIACISDLVVQRLCGNESIITHPTNGAALGFYDIDTNTFDVERLGLLGIRESELPTVAQDFEVCGHFRGIPVTVSIGDNQASVFGSLKSDDVLLNIGTSGQVCFVERSAASVYAENSSCELRPYFDGCLLHSGSVLCGGRAISILADFVRSIAVNFGAIPSKEQIYDYICRSALESRSTLDVRTSFSGTRDEPESTGSIGGITVNNFNFGEVAGGFCRGVVDELHALYTAMTDERPKRLVVSGNALRRNPALRKFAREIFGCPISLPSHVEEAAYGAALFSAVGSGRISLDEARSLITHIDYDEKGDIL